VDRNLLQEALARYVFSFFLYIYRFLVEQSAESEEGSTVDLSAPAPPLQPYQMPTSPPVVYPLQQQQSFHPMPPSPAPMQQFSPSPYHHPTSLQPPSYQFPQASASRGPPQSPADPRVKDSIELCNFAISALNVSSFYFSISFVKFFL
jgi:hypothetical protein